jgi:transcriptional regulator with XRE-family HTH domain
MDINCFARRLKQARERTDLTQTALGEKIGIHPSVASARINRYERGTRQPNFVTLGKIAVALNISPSYFCETDDMIADFIYLLCSMDDEKRDNAMIMLIKLNGTPDKD